MNAPRALASLLALALLTAAAGAAAQGVGINASGAAADTSAILDLASTSKGLLPPRMTAAQRGIIVLPATGLVVYQTDGAAGFYYNAGTPLSPSWRQLAEVGGGGGGQWSTSGSDLYHAAGRVGVGTSAFVGRLTVVDNAYGLRVQSNNAGSTLASFGGAGQFQIDAPGVAGGRFQLLENGYLGLGRTAPQARLDIAGGNWDVVNGEGDLRIGDAATRLKIGIATGGGGTGAATLMVQGPVGAYNTLSLGTQGNRVLYVNGATQRVGIGTDAPNAPLGFPPVLGKKITLYPGATGDVGIGVSGNRLQLYADHPGADVAVGYDQAGVFNERFAFKPTGALAVNGNAGAAGQVLQSNGGGTAATWVNPTAANYAGVYQVNSATKVAFPTNTINSPLPDLSQGFTTTGNARVIVSVIVKVHDVDCAFCGGSSASIGLFVDDNVLNYVNHRLDNGGYGTVTATTSTTVGPGAHSVDVRGSAYGKTIEFGDSPVMFGNSLTVQVIPQ